MDPAYSTPNKEETYDEETSESEPPSTDKKLPQVPTVDFSDAHNWLHTLDITIIKTYSVHPIVDGAVSLD
jgi:hypothetical protein